MRLDSRAKALLVIVLYGALVYAVIYAILVVSWPSDLPGADPHWGTR